MEGLYKTDTHIEDCSKFILTCQDAISLEKNAWMTEVVKEHHQREK